MTELSNLLYLTEKKPAGTNGRVAFSTDYDAQRINVLNFSASTAKAEVTGLSSFESETIAITFTTPVQVNTASSGQVLIGLESLSGDIFSYIGIGSITGAVSNETFCIVYRGGASTRRTAVQNYIFEADTIYKIVMRWNGSSYSIYINNEIQTTISSSGGHVPLMTTNDMVSLGYYGANFNFSGVIADVAIWQDGISSDERDDYFNTGYVDDADVDLICHYKVDEGTGSTLDNAQGDASFDLTITDASWQTFETLAHQNATWLNNEGNEIIKTGGYLFNGTNSYIEIADHDDFTQDEFSIYKKINTTYTGSQTLASHYRYTAAQRSWLLFMENGGEIAFYVSDDGNGSNIKRYTTVETFADGKEHKIFITFSVSSDELIIYVDGVEKDVNKDTDVTIASVHNSNVNIYLGRQYDASGTYYTGRQSDFRFYAEVLSASTIWDFCSYAKEPSTTNLKCHIPMLQGAIDISGNGHHGTVSNCTYVPDLLNEPEKGYSLITSTESQVKVFNGINSKISCGDIGVGNGTNSFSYEAWIKCFYHNGVTAQSIMTYGQNSNSSRCMLYIGGTGTQFALRRENTSASSNTAVSNTYSLSDIVGKWFYLCGTYDGSDIRLYVNGYLQGTIASTLTVSCNLFSIGHTERTPTYPFYGIIANAVTYNDVRSDAEVLENFLKGFPDITDANIQNYWPLENDYLDKVGSYDGSASNVTSSKSIFRPQPEEPTEQTIDISALGDVSTFEYKIDFESRNTDRTFALDSISLEYIEIVAQIKSSMLLMGIG